MTADPTPSEPTLDLEAIRSRNERAMSTKLSATLDELLMLHERDIPALLARCTALDAENAMLRKLLPISTYRLDGELPEDVRFVRHVWASDGTYLGVDYSNSSHGPFTRIRAALASSAVPHEGTQ